MADFGMNLRVTMDSKQGGRKYMEDVLSVKFQKTDDGRNIEYTYLAVFDGHGGAEAAKFAKEHLLKEVTKQKGFWSDDDDEVKQAIREGFLATHRLMWKAVGTWPKTLTGYPSTAGTTASVVFIRNGKMYVAHVGDSTVVMGMKHAEDEDPTAISITDDHKPDAPKELKRIEEDGGQVIAKAGVQRVVWHRPKISTGPVRRSTNVDNIPFLAIARALGDLWSYNATTDAFVVSPDPDIATFCIDLRDHKFVILASDGLWNMVKPQEAVDIVHELDPQSKDPYLGRKPASLLVHIALDRWSKRMLRADNTSVIVAYFDPPGSHKESLFRQPSDLSTASTLKATSDGEEDSDLELEEIFPSDGMLLDDGEESHQAALVDRGTITMKPTLKRLPAAANMSPAQLQRPLCSSASSSSSNKKHARSHTKSKPKCPLKSSHSSSPGSAFMKAAKHFNLMCKDARETSKLVPAEVVIDSENDPNKVSIISVTTSPDGNNTSIGSKCTNEKRLLANFKRSSSNFEESGSTPAKRPRLAVPESSHIADSPMIAKRTRKNSGQQLLDSSPSCSSPLNIDLTPGTSSDLGMISPLWPSHLADDLHSDNAVSTDSVTSIKPRLHKGESIPRDVLQENSPAALLKVSPNSSCSSPGAASGSGSSGKFAAVGGVRSSPSISPSPSATVASGSQNKSPATRQRLSVKQRHASPRNTMRQTRLSPHAAKLSRTVHQRVARTLKKSTPPKQS